MLTLQVESMSLCMSATIVVNRLRSMAILVRCKPQFLYCFCLVFIGRSVMLLWMGDASVHELYTAACGLYIIWLVCRVGSVFLSWFPLGWKGVAGKFFEWFLLVSYLCILSFSQSK